MNWTGGALGRGSRNAKTSLSVIQKRHFAKVRGRLQNSRPSPPSIRFHDFPAFGEVASTHKTSHSSLDRHDRKRHSHTLVKNVNSNTKPTDASAESAKNKQLPSRHERILVRQERDQSQPGHATHKKVSYINISSRASTTLPEDEEDDVTQVRGNVPQAPGTDNIEAQRQRLLRMGDWVGFERHTKPVRMDFADERDRDQIGKRRHISQKPQLWDREHGPAKKRLKRTSYFGNLSHDKDFANDYISQADISVRIGSAVDRSVRNEKARRSLSKQSRRSLGSDEMLLDGRDPERDCVDSDSEYRSCFPRGRSMPTPGYQRQEILDPLELLGVSSPLSPDFRKIERRSQQVRLSKVPEVEDLIPQYDSKEPTHRNCVSPNESSPFRLVFRRTPRPYCGHSETNSSTPIARDVAYEHNKTYLTPSRTYLASSTQNSDSSNSLIAASVIRLVPDLLHPRPQKPLRAMVLEGEDMSRVAERRDLLGRRDRLRSEIDMQNDTDSRHELHKKPNDHQESANEEDTWRNLVNISVEDVHEQPVAPAAKTTKADSLEHVEQDRQKPYPERPSPKEKPRDSTPEEEKIWRKIIFGDDDPNKEWVLEDPKYQPARTQPSMIAEVDTSPVLQNPHLHRDASSSSSPGPQEASMVAEASTSSNPEPEPGECFSDTPRRHSPPSGPTLQQGLAAPETHSAPSLLAKVPSSTQQPPVQTPTQTLHAPQRPSPSSIAVQAPTTPRLSHPSQTRPIPASDTDESSRRPVRTPPRPKVPVVFRKPWRYVGERSSDPQEPIHIGLRTLMSGKRVQEVEEGDEIVDD